MLTGGSRVLQERQQTLRALVDWSYELLTENEQTLLKRLAVFAGGFDLDAAEKVCGVEPIEDFEVLDLLASLVDKSLVMLEEREEASRYRMLETIRDYAAQKLRADGDDGAAAAVRHNGITSSWPSMRVKASMAPSRLTGCGGSKSNSTTSALPWRSLWPGGSIR